MRRALSIARPLHDQGSRGCAVPANAGRKLSSWYDICFLFSAIVSKTGGLMQPGFIVDELQAGAKYCNFI